MVKLTTFNFTPDLKKGGLLKHKVRWCARQTTLQLIFIITAWVYTQEAPRIDEWKSKCEHGDYWHCLVDLRELSDTVQETTVWRACSQNWHMPAAWQCLLETSYLKNKLTYFLQNNQAPTLFSILCERKTPRSLLTDLTSISRSNRTALSILTFMSKNKASVVPHP